MRGNERGPVVPSGAAGDQAGDIQQCMSKVAHPGDSYQECRSEVHPRGRAGDWNSCSLAQGGAEGHGPSWSGAPGSLLWVQKCHWAYSSTEPVREPNTGGTGSNMSFELRLETGVAGPMPPPTGNWKRPRCGLLGSLPFILTNTSTALSSIFPIADGRLLLFSSRGQGVVEIYCCSWLSLLRAARERRWGPELSQEPGRERCSIAV